jgi:hypothetical protein
MLRGATAAAAAVVLTLVAGCGDDEPDAEPTASYRVGAPRATFPPQQQLAHAVELRIALRNTGRRTIPNVSATLLTGGGGDDATEAFAARSEEEGLASRSRPVWIVDEGPVSGDTAFGNTWALGSLAPGRTKTFTWRVVPVRAGRYELRYRLFGSTSGRSALRLADGSAPGGTLKVRVSGKPAQVRVTPDGRIVEVSPS